MVGASATVLGLWCTTTSEQVLGASRVTCALVPQLNICAVAQVAQLATTTCATNFVLPVSGTICTTSAKDIINWQNCAQLWHK